MATICTVVLTLPSMCTATLLLAPILAIHSRSAEIAISRPMMISATNTSVRCRCTNTSSEAQTRNLSATGSRKAPKDEVWFSRRARKPSSQSVHAKTMNITVAAMLAVCCSIGR